MLRSPYVATAPSIRIVKQFNLRGGSGHFSNRYHFSGGTPADSAHWTTLANAIIAAEKALYLPIASGGATIVEAVGYAGGSEIPVFTAAYSTAGTGSFAGYVPQASDVAGLIRYSTPDRSSKNHPIYCFNYYHAVGSAGTFANLDAMDAAQLAAFGVYGADWIAGFSDGANTYKRSRPNGNTCNGYFVEPSLTHRDLPR